MLINRTQERTHLEAILHYVAKLEVMPEMSDQSPRSDAMADAVDAVLSLARQLARRRAEIQDIVSLTGTEITVMDQIHHNPGISPTTIAANTGLKRSNVSTALRLLESRQMIVRQQTAGNDRSIDIYPTNLARENLQRLRTAWADKLDDAPDELVTQLLGASAAMEKLSAFYIAQNG